MNLKGKKIVVIGGEGFLGKHLCKKLIDLKAKVISADNKKILKNQKEKKFKNKSQIHYYSVDATNENSMNLFYENIIKSQKKIDILIYTITTKPDDFYSPFTSASLKGWKKIISTELDGAFLAAKLFGKHMEKRKSGKMIFLSSIYGMVGNDQRIYEGSNLSKLRKLNSKNKKKQFSHAAYSVSKGGIITLTKFLAAYWGNKNINVNCISPGGIKSKRENKNFEKKYNEKVPLKRMANINDVLNAIIFLSSDNSNYITGHNLIVDGGWTSW